MQETDFLSGYLRVTADYFCEDISYQKASFTLSASLLVLLQMSFYNDFQRFRDFILFILSFSFFSFPLPPNSLCPFVRLCSLSALLCQPWNFDILTTNTIF